MEDIGYPELEGHRAEHKKLAAQVQIFQRQYDEGRHAAVDELLKFLKNWLIDHIILADTKYWPWIDRVRPSLDNQGDFIRQPPGKKG